MNALTVEQNTELKTLIDAWATRKGILKPGEILVVDIGVVKCPVVELRDTGKVDSTIPVTDPMFKPGETAVTDIQHLSPYEFSEGNVASIHLISDSGVVTMGQLLRLSEEEIGRLDQMGPKRVSSIKEYIRLFGFGFGTRLPISDKEREVILDPERFFLWGVFDAQREVDDVLKKYKIENVFDLRCLTRSTAQLFVDDLNKMGDKKRFAFKIYGRWYSKIDLEGLELYMKSLDLTFAQ